MGPVCIGIPRFGDLLHLVTLEGELKLRQKPKPAQRHISCFTSPQKGKHRRVFASSIAGLTIR